MGLVAWEFSCKARQHKANAPRELRNRYMLWKYILMRSLGVLSGKRVATQASAMSGVRFNASKTCSTHSMAVELVQWNSPSWAGDGAGGTVRGGT